MWWAKAPRTVLRPMIVRYAAISDRDMFRRKFKRKPKPAVYKDKGSSWGGNTGRKRAVYHKQQERATLRAHFTLEDKPPGKRWNRFDFDKARSTLNYMRTQRNSNKRTVHGALDLLDRMMHEIRDQEQMYRSDWCTFEFIEPLLLNWKQAWREEWDREQNIYTPTALLEKLLMIPFPEGFDPERKTAETILCGMIEVAHKFDKPILGEEMLEQMEHITLAHCKHVLRAWITSQKWDDKDINGTKAFVHTMVSKYNHMPDAETYKMLQEFLGSDSAMETVLSALLGVPPEEQVKTLSAIGLTEQAQEKLNDLDTVEAAVIRRSVLAILLACGDDHELALDHHRRSLHLLDDESNDLALEPLMDFYVEKQLTAAVKAFFGLFRLRKPYASLLYALARDGEEEEALKLVQQHPEPVVIDAAVRSFVANPDVVVRIFNLLRNDPDCKARKIQPTLSLLNIVLDHFSESPDQAKEVYNFVQRAEEAVEPNDYSYKLAIEICLNSNLLFEANELARRVKSFVEEDVSLVRSWAEAGTRSAAAKTSALLAEIEAPTMLAYNVYIYSIIMSAHPERGLQIEEVFDRARQDNLQPDEVSLELALDFLSQSSDEDITRGVQLLNALENPKKEHFECLIAGRIRRRDAKGAKKILFKQIEDFVNKKDPSLQPNQNFVYSITRSLIKGNQIGKAHHFIELMTDLYLEEYIPVGPDKRTIRILLDAWGMCDDPAKDVYINEIINDFKDVYDEKDANEILEPSNPFEPKGNIPDPPGTPVEMNYYEIEGLSDSDDGSDNESPSDDDRDNESDSNDDESDFDNNDPLFEPIDDDGTDESFINFDSDSDSDEDDGVDYDTLFADQCSENVSDPLLDS